MVLLISTNVCSPAFKKSVWSFGLPYVPSLFSSRWNRTLREDLEFYVHHISSGRTKVQWFYKLREVSLLFKDLYVPAIWLKWRYISLRRRLARYGHILNFYVLGVYVFTIYIFGGKGWNTQFNIWNVKFQKKYYGVGFAIKWLHFTLFTMTMISWTPVLGCLVVLLTDFN